MTAEINHPFLDTLKQKLELNSIVGYVKLLNKILDLALKVYSAKIQTSVILLIYSYLISSKNVKNGIRCSTSIPLCPR